MGTQVSLFWSLLNNCLLPLNQILLEIVDHTNVIVLFSDLAIQSEFQFLRYICKQ